MKNYRWLIVMLGASLLFACGSDPDPGPTSDTTSDTATNDTTNNNDAGSDQGVVTPPDTTANNDTGSQIDLVTPPPPTGDCSRNGIAVAQATAQKDEGNQFIGYEGQTAQNAAGNIDVLSIQIYYAPQFAGPTTPGTYSLAGTNYEDCGLCVLIYANCGQSSCEKTFYADEGSVTISEIDGQLAASLSGVKLKEVNINAQTFRSTPVPGGETWCIDEGMQVSAQFAAGPPSGPDELPTATDPASAECVADGNGHWVGNNIGDFSLTNCNGETVNLHAGCGTQKAMWLISTAGWCTACTSYINALKSEWGTTNLTAADVPEGVQLWVVLAENEAQGKPTAEYCNQYATQKGIDPSMLLLDWSDTQVQVQLAHPQESAIVTNGLAATWAKINPYLVADASGSVMSGFPWNAVLRGSNGEYVFSDFFDQSKQASGVVNQLLAE